MTIERALELLPQMRDSEWITVVGQATDIYTDEAKEAFNTAISALEFKERYDQFWEKVKTAGKSGKEIEIHRFTTAEGYSESERWHNDKQRSN